MKMIDNNIKIALQICNEALDSVRSSDDTYGCYCLASLALQCVLSSFDDGLPVNGAMIDLLQKSLKQDGDNLIPSMWKRIKAIENGSYDCVS